LKLFDAPPPPSAEEQSRVLDKARDLIAPVLGASTCTALLDKLLALENVKDVHELRPLLQRS